MSNTQIRGANNGSGTSQIKPGTLSNADIHASAAIALSKLAEAVIQADGGQAFTADQSHGGFKITNLAAGTASTDAVNKGQLDAASAGLDYKEAVRLATTATQGTLYTIMSNTVGASNGVVLNVTGGSGTFDPDAGETIVTSGGTATIVAVDNVTAGSTTKIWVRNITGSALTTSFTSHSGGVTGLTISSIDTTSYVAYIATSAVGVQNIDSTTVAVGNRILVKNQVTTTQNGIYRVILVGTASLTQVIARTDDMDGTPTNEISTGNAVFVVAGSTLATTGWVLSTTDAADPDNISVHTETKVFAQFNAASSYTASNGITLSGNDFQLNLTGLTTATIVSADEIPFADASDSNNEKKTTFANFEAALTLDNQLGTLSVSKGGTGATTLTSNGVLYGNGTSAIGATAAGAANTFLYSNAGTPAFTSNVFVTQSASAAELYSNASTSFALKATATAASLLATTANHGAGASGQISVSTGTGTGGTGLLSLDTGAASGGNSGGITITTGNAASGNSGAVTISTGTASGTIGSIVFAPGGVTTADVAADGFNIITGTSYQINNTSVLNATTLGSSVVTSSLTSVGTLTSGTWNASVIGTLYGGTGLAITPTAIADGEILIGSNAGDAFVRTTITAGTGISVTNGAGSITIAVAAAVITSSDIVTGETPSGTVNGSNDTFTIASTPLTGTVRVYLNGIRQKSGSGNDYQISGSTITFEAGNIPQTDDVILADYFI